MHVCVCVCVLYVHVFEGQGCREVGFSGFRSLSFFLVVGEWFVRNVMKGATIVIISNGRQI